ncbi:MAG: mechanosensitive ion channel family protein [Treponema sp.]|nr:mechanosensitive ion channel family protein [Treponema sp.]
MRNLLFIFLLSLPFVFISAQDSGESESDTTVQITENVPESAETVSESADTDAVTSASWIKTVRFEYMWSESIGKLSFLQRLGIALAIIAVQILVIWLIWFLFKRINNKLENNAGKDKIKPLYFHKYKVLSSNQVIEVIEVFLRIFKYIVTAIILLLTIPFVFSFFHTTKNFATMLLGYILSPIRDIVIGVVMYIPNLIKVIIFVIVTRYILKGLKYFANQLEKGKLKFSGFYPDWAAPTYRILQVLLWAFTVAIIYPYLPGSDSRAFQGVSVFVGIIFSLGSTSAIGNLVAGLVITYMRPFKIGDRVKIIDTTGFVVEKNHMVVRVKTHKNEYVTFPNLTILNSNIVNYNTSSDEDEEGLIIYTEVTFGYSTPWQTVHDVLINAALATDYVQKKPKPFVLQTKLDDFYACYQINCYTKDVSKIPSIYTMLYENIQNGFKESGIDMTSAHYRVIYKEK